MDPKGPKEQNERNEWMQGLALLAWISWEVVLWSGTGLLLGYWVAGKIGAPGWIAVIPLWRALHSPSGGFTKRAQNSEARHESS